MRWKTLAAMSLMFFMAAGCAKHEGPARPKIGLSLDTLKEERWQHDRDMIVAKCNELGVDVVVQAANNDDTRQISQAENLLTEGVKVLIVVPHNGKTAATIVTMAHKTGVPVIAYDRLIRDCDLDYYVAFDAPRIGEFQADYLVKRVPKGNYVIIEGSPTDNNAQLLRDGQMKVLKPYIDKGAIKIVGDQWANDWSPIEALKITENILTKNKNKVDAILVSNDGMAGGVVQALAGQNLAGKVLVTGQDGDLAACQRIVAGTQTMTIYKPLKLEAWKAAELAVALVKQQPIVEKTTLVDNGKVKVKSFLLDTIQVDKTNLDDTVIADGFQKKDEVYKK